MANGRRLFVFEVDTGSMTSPLSSELPSEMGLTASDATNRRAQIGLTSGFSVPMPVDFASFAGLWPLTGRRIYDPTATWRKLHVPFLNVLAQADNELGGLEG